MEASGLAGEDLSLPSEHLQHAGQSLPELTDELITAQTTQCSEVQQKEELLQKLENELSSVEEQLQSVCKGVSICVRTICLKENLLAELGTECQELEEKVFKLVKEKQRLGVCLEKLHSEDELELKTRVQYITKIESHQTKVKQLEGLSATRLELEDLKEKVVCLKSKRAKYFDEDGLAQVMNGEKQQCLQDELAAVQASTEILRQENTLLEEKILTGENCIGLLRKDIETGQKRQTAQLRRLQRLVNEAQARRRQWVEEGERLAASISQIKMRIEEK